MRTIYYSALTLSLPVDSWSSPEELRITEENSKLNRSNGAHVFQPVLFGQSEWPFTREKVA